MIGHFVFLGLLFVFGLLFILLIRPKHASFLSFMLSFFIGAAFWGIIILIFSIFKITVNIFTIGSVVIVLFSMIIVALILQKKKLLSRQELPGFIAVILIHVVIFYIFSVKVYTFATPDSFDYIKIGRIFSQFNWEYTARSFVAYGPLLSFIEIGASLFNLEYFYGLIPTSMTIFIIAFLAFCYEGLSSVLSKENKILTIKIHKDKFRFSIPVIFTSLIGLLFLTNYFFQLMSFYIHTNPLAMIYMTMTFLSTWFAVVKKDRNWLVISAVLGTAMSITRVETFFIAIIPIFFILDTKVFSKKNIRLAFLPGSVLISLWSIRKYLVSVGQSGVYVNQAYNLGIIIISIGLVAILILHPYLEKFKINYIILVVILLGIAFIGLIIFRFQLLSQSLYNLYINLFNVAHWNYIWYITIPLYVYCLIAPKRSNSESIFRWGILICILIIIESAGLRGGSFHDRWTDSGNRMMFQVLPLMVFYTISKIVSSKPSLEKE